MQELVLTPLYLGFTLGLTHAFDPDHLVAVSTLVSQEKSVRRSSLVGVIWGLGHTASLTLVGFVVLILKLTIPPALARGMELGVALMIILLGGNLLWRYVQTLPCIPIHTPTKVLPTPTYTCTAETQLTTATISCTLAASPLRWG